MFKNYSEKFDQSISQFVFNSITQFFFGQIQLIKLLSADQRQAGMGSYYLDETRRGIINCS